jgi:hypothetical protein
MMIMMMMNKKLSVQNELLKKSFIFL